MHKQSESVKRDKKPMSRTDGPRKFMAKSGLEIFVGKCARGNDQLTFANWPRGQQCKWLHVKDEPGSHVLLIGSSSMADIREAAVLALRFSSLKSLKGVVEYCDLSQVSKHRNAAPGEVVIIGPVYEVRIK